MLSGPEGRGALAGLEQALEPDLAEWARPSLGPAREPVQAVPLELLAPELMRSLAARRAE